MKIKKNVLLYGFVCLSLAITHAFGYECNHKIANNKLAQDANIITAIEVVIDDSDSYRNDYYDLLISKQDLIIAAADAIIFEATKQKERAGWQCERDIVIQEIDAAKYAKEVAQKNKQKIQLVIDNSIKEQRELNEAILKQEQEQENDTLCVGIDCDWHYVENVGMNIIM